MSDITKTAVKYGPIETISFYPQSFEKVRSIESIFPKKWQRIHTFDTRQYITNRVTTLSKKLNGETPSRFRNKIDCLLYKY